jgi:hypothetical protein
MCSSKYGLKGGLNGHIKTVHENLKPFQCQKCSSKYALKYALNRHIRRVHENGKSPENLI